MIPIENTSALDCQATAWAHLVGRHSAVRQAARYERTRLPASSEQGDAWRGGGRIHPERVTRCVSCQETLLAVSSQDVSATTVGVPSQGGPRAPGPGWRLIELEVPGSRE